jgi:uncharacterized repeat protein (TIGR03803 family)
MKMKLTFICDVHTPRGHSLRQIKIGMLVALGLAATIALSRAVTFTTIKSFGVVSNISGFTPQAALIQGPDGTLYGTTFSGEGTVLGTVFKIQPDGSGFSALKLFTNSVEGADPHAALTLSGNVLYGTTANGGFWNSGTVFKMNTDGTGFTVLWDFQGGDGANPYAGVTLSDNVLYGTTANGGSWNTGVVFKVNINGTGYTVLKHFFGDDGATPHGDLALAGGILYGTTYGGGSASRGTVFKMNIDGTDYTVLTNFTDGGGPMGSLALSGNMLYGTTVNGGSKNGGVVYKLSTDGTSYTVLKEFAFTNGANPQGGITLSGGVLYGTAARGGIDGNVFKVNTGGSGFTILKNFSYSTNGAYPNAGVIVSSGVIYGTASSGGFPEPTVAATHGTLFRVNIDGTGFSVLKRFAFSDGISPQGNLTLSGSTLYGTTYDGGFSGNGTVFKIEKDGTGYTVLKNLDGLPNDATRPCSGVVLSGNVLFGTTRGGGGGNNGGTIFKVNTDGTGYSLVKTFGGSSGYDLFAGLTRSGNVLYGGTSGGGTIFKINENGTGFAVLNNIGCHFGLAVSNGVIYASTGFYNGGANGTVYKINTDGTGYAVLKDFSDPDGRWPSAQLTLSGNVLYGTTYANGGSGYGTVFKVNTDGSGFTVIKDFFGGPDGGYPQARLLLVGNVLYGTTYYQGVSNFGTVFKLNTDGSDYAVLKSFTGGSDGGYPLAGLTLVDNALYGTTSVGGIFGQGTIFKIDLLPLLTIQPLGKDVVLSWDDPRLLAAVGPNRGRTLHNHPWIDEPIYSCCRQRPTVFPADRKLKTAECDGIGASLR